MTKKFSVADHVRWNSEAGDVHGTITKVHRKDVIKSNTTDHVAMHKGSALTTDSQGCELHRCDDVRARLHESGV